MNLELFLNDGHWIVGKNILSYLDPESLVQVGSASRTAKKFVLSYLETSLEENYRKQILDLDTTKSTMSEERRKSDGKQWAKLFALVKNGSIRQMSMMMPLIKNTDRTITTFNSFHPAVNLTYHVLCTDSNDEELDVQKINTWKAFESFLDDRYLYRTFTYYIWDAMMGLVLTSENENVVRFFSRKMLKIDPLYFISDTRSFDPDDSTSDVKNELINRAKHCFNLELGESFFQ